MYTLKVFIEIWQLCKIFQCHITVYTIYEAWFRRA